MPTDNTIVQGSSGNFSAVPNVGSAFRNPPSAAVDSASQGLGVTVAPGAPDANGNPTFDVAVPASVPAGTVIQLGGSDVTAAGTITASLSITVTAGTPPPTPEPTSFTFVQNS